MFSFWVTNYLVLQVEIIESRVPNSVLNFLFWKCIFRRYAGPEDRQLPDMNGPERRALAVLLKPGNDEQGLRNHIPAIYRRVLVFQGGIFRIAREPGLNNPTVENGFSFPSCGRESAFRLKRCRMSGSARRGPNDSCNLNRIFWRLRRDTEFRRHRCTLRLVTESHKVRQPRQEYKT